eukprot:CAMPEP_0197874382 /NCGR_PEP_ID=MMETSP1439-20131203/3904_1 /TAXON_ID=66791 /ORGANISM="Gonyaulax spinifera, Strain CCMP409" /LENGTH=162 /DNA_ID=CAMNT_0043493489 /DNA_START=77 /DNA_END=561 /DNA_ORIENTATION=-
MAAMKIITLALLLAPLRFAAGSRVATRSGRRAGTQAVCGPQTQVCTAGRADAAGTPQWACKPVVDGAQVSMDKSQYKFGAKVCGPGKFFFSPMTCAGGRFEYKKATVEVDKTSTTTACQPVSFPYDMALLLRELLSWALGTLCCAASAGRVACWRLHQHTCD